MEDKTIDRGRTGILRSQKNITLGDNLGVKLIKKVRFAEEHDLAPHELSYILFHIINAFDLIAEQLTYDIKSQPL